MLLMLKHIVRVALIISFEFLVLKYSFLYKAGHGAGLYLGFALIFASVLLYLYVFVFSNNKNNTPNY